MRSKPWHRSEDKKIFSGVTKMDISTARKWSFKQVMSLAYIKRIDRVALIGWQDKGESQLFKI